MSKEFPSSDIRKIVLDLDHDSHGLIQWKGTQVCCDIWCKCGEQFHLDVDFMYHVKCSACGRVYECNGHFALHEIDEASVDHYFLMKDDEVEDVWKDKR